jgi:uncharacterized protein (DUF433 family)
VIQITESYPHLTTEAVQQAISFAAYNLRNDFFYEINSAA